MNSIQPHTPDSSIAQAVSIPASPAVQLVKYICITTIAHGGNPQDRVVALFTVYILRSYRVSNVRLFLSYNALYTIFKVLPILGFCFPLFGYWQPIETLEYIIQQSKPLLAQDCMNIELTAQNKMPSRN
jgi:hypothetical protein